MNFWNNKDPKKESCIYPNLNKVVEKRGQKGYDDNLILESFKIQNKIAKVMTVVSGW